MITDTFIKKLSVQLQTMLQQSVQVNATQQIFGGDINSTFLLQTNTGNFFLKLNDHTKPGMFAAEYRGLKLLKEAGSIYIPDPLLYGNIGNNSFLLMEYLPKGKPLADFWKHFAAGLAGLHRQTQVYFGLHENNFIGSAQQFNNTRDTWSVFYATQRILPLMQKAFDQQKCSSADLRTVEKVCNRFNEIFPLEQPALLHGDLWSGNFMVLNTGLPAIYDPAVYYGYREMDIAMTLLFGGFDKKFYTVYNEIFPLQKGWEQRVDICQLYPLLLHFLLFGGHYYYSVKKIIRKYD